MTNLIETYNPKMCDLPNIIHEWFTPKFLEVKLEPDLVCGYSKRYTTW